jgi:DNA-binding beta-propeller fold protein YncE
LITQIDNLDGNAPSIVRTGRFGPSGSTSTTQGAVVSHDGKTLVTAGTNGVIWIDTATLQVRSRVLTSWSVWSLAASPDGAMLYAVNDAGSIAELSMTSGKVVATFDPAAGFPMGLLRVEPA